MHDERDNATNSEQAGLAHSQQKENAGAKESDKGYAEEPLLKFFAWAHLPPHLQAISQPFCELACTIVERLPRNAERTVALRKLLEAKDAGVRAAL